MATSATTSIRPAMDFNRRLALSFMDPYPLSGSNLPAERPLVQNSRTGSAFPAFSFGGLCFPIFSVFSRTDSHRERRQARGLNEISETGTDRHRGQRSFVRPVGHERMERLRRCGFASLAANLHRSGL